MLRIRLALAALLLAALLVGGCGDDRPRVAHRPPPSTAPPPRPYRTADSIYGPDGDLLESRERVAGLRLPRGLTKVISRSRRHVYRSEAPTGKLARFFGPRLVTGAVQRRRGVVTYQNAVPRGVRGGVVHLDVTMEPIAGAGARLEIRERRPPVPRRIPATEIQRHLRDRARRAE